MRAKARVFMEIGAFSGVAFARRRERVLGYLLEAVYVRIYTGLNLGLDRSRDFSG